MARRREPAGRAGHELRARRRGLAPQPRRGVRRGQQLQAQRLPPLCAQVHEPRRRLDHDHRRPARQQPELLDRAGPRRAGPALSWAPSSGPSSRSTAASRGWTSTAGCPRSPCASSRSRSARATWWPQPSAAASTWSTTTRRSASWPARRTGFLAGGGHIFEVADGDMYVPWNPGGANGSDFYAADNPPLGVAFTYWVGETLRTREAERRAAERRAQRAGEDTPYPSWEELEAEDREEAPRVFLTVHDDAGNVVNVVNGSTSRGVHRAVWNYRYPGYNPVTGGGGGGGRLRWIRRLRWRRQRPDGAAGRLHGVAGAARRRRGDRAGRAGAVHDRPAQPARDRPAGPGGHPRVPARDGRASPRGDGQPARGGGSRAEDRGHQAGAAAAGPLRRAS